MINVYKIFIGFSYFRFKERYISIRKLKRKINKNKTILIFLHPKFDIEVVKEHFCNRWNNVFNTLNWEVNFLDEESFKSWWIELKNSNEWENVLRKKSFVFITDIYLARKIYRNVLMTTPKTFLLKNPKKVLLKDTSGSKFLFTPSYIEEN